MDNNKYVKLKLGSFSASIPPSVTGIADAVKEKGLEALINNLNFSFVIFLSPLFNIIIAYPKQVLDKL
jgi:hypothetical protein